MSTPKEIASQGQRILHLADGAEQLRAEQTDADTRLRGIEEDLRLLGAALGIEGPKVFSPEVASSPVSFDLSAAAGCLEPSTLALLDREFLASVPAVPPMDALDRFVVISVGCLAALADFLLVGMPPDTKWTPRVEGGRVPVGWLSERLKSWNVDNDNWLARLCPVPYDKSTFPGTDMGFSPVNHRVLSFGHDPSPFGFVIGLMDIAAGHLTGTTLDGQVFSVPTVPTSWIQVCLAPILWVAHLVSDVATKMGIPVPGSSLLMLVRLPMPGAPDDATVADVARVLYQQGFDFRHYMAGGVVPGLVEGLIRLYDWLRYSKRPSDLRSPIRVMHAESHVAAAQGKARLASRLFWSHAIAAGANAGRVALQAGGTGDFFSAARNVNLAEWQVFGLRSVQYAMALARDTDVDQALVNRGNLERKWDDLAGVDTAGTELYRADGPNAGRVTL